MRLLFDENLSALSAQWVTSTLAVDVLDARSAGLAGKTDQEIRQFAVETGRILVLIDLPLPLPCFRPSPSRQRQRPRSACLREATANRP